MDDSGTGAEFAIVGCDEAEATVDVVEEQDSRTTLTVDRGGEPDFAVDFGGSEVEAQAFVDVEDEAAADLEVVEEVTFATDEDAVLFVDPDGADEIADDTFEWISGLDAGIAGIVCDDGWAAVEIDAARVGEGAEFEDAGGGKDDVAAGVRVLAFGFVLLAAGLSPGYFFVDAVTFFQRFFGGERLAVASYDAVDAYAVDGHAFRVSDSGLLDVAFAAEVLLFKMHVVGVVLACGFGGLLVAFDVKEEFADGR